MHWLLGQSLSARGYIYEGTEENTYHAVYDVIYAPFPLYASTILMLGMTIVCWWAYYYKREGFIPTMYGSARACYAGTVGTTKIGSNGLKWGDLGKPPDARFRHAGFSSGKVGSIVPGELYA